MANETLFTLQFPSESGFDRSDIFFHRGTPDLLSVYPADPEKKQFRLFVTDTNIIQLECMKDFASSFGWQGQICTGRYFRGKDILLVIGAGETYKTMESVLEINTAALEANFDRGCLFVSIGGGVLCDMTAFAASMFKRGVAVEFVPTTLLAMVDASVGGKTGCDYRGFKNMLGAFYPAQKLHVWPSFVQSLPENEYISGLSEAIKTAFLFNTEMKKMFRENAAKVMERQEEILDTVIPECVKAKAMIVHEDLREKGRRAFLNLGHTFGHALEAVAGLGKITHGGAVAWGMGRAACLSFNLGLCPQSYRDEVLEILELYGYDFKAVPECLENAPADTVDRMMDAMRKDKKTESDGKIRMILQKDFEDTRILKVDDSKVLEVLK